MTNEERTELVKRLMTSVTLTFTIPGGAQAADQIETDGDRIKELEAEVKRLRKKVQSLTDELGYHGIYPRPLLGEKQ